MRYLHFSHNIICDFIGSSVALQNLCASRHCFQIYIVLIGFPSVLTNLARRRSLISICMVCSFGMFCHYFRTENVTENDQWKGFVICCLSSVTVSLSCINVPFGCKQSTFQIVKNESIVIMKEYAIE